MCRNLAGHPCHFSVAGQTGGGSRLNFLTRVRSIMPGGPRYPRCQKGHGGPAGSRRATVTLATSDGPRGKCVVKLVSIVTQRPVGSEVKDFEKVPAAGSYRLH